MKYREVDDDAIAGNTWFFVETYKIFQEGLKALLNKIMEFDGLVKELELSESPYEYDKKRIEKMIHYGEKELQKKDDYDEIVIDGVSYGSLRYLKAGIIMLVQKLEDKKNKILQEYDFLPKAVIESLDEKINILRDKAEMGLLNGLSPADIFFDIKKLKYSTQERKSVEKDKMETYILPEKLLVRTEHLQVLDNELRKRCLRLLKSEDFKDQLDTVVREMSVILENRIRTRAGIKEKLTGPSLMGKVFGGDNPILFFSEEKDLQESAHHLYRGYSGFVRNEVMHKIVATFTKDRVIQLLGFVDYLLFLLTQTKKRRAKSKRIK